MILGFTGTSRSLSDKDRERLSTALRDLVLSKRPEGIVTGACVGVDSFVHHWFAENHPDIHRTVVFPGDLKAVDHSVKDNAHEVIWMLSGSSYRVRNTKMVELSDEMAAFWTGQRRSGTFMTMNIARRADKMPSGNIFGMGLPNDVVRVRYERE